MSGACEDLAPLVAALPLGVLEPAEQERIEAHLAECDVCPTLSGDVEKALALTVPMAVPDGVVAETSWLAINDRIDAEKVRERVGEGLVVRVSLSCAYCHSGMARSEAAFCATCLAPHHEDCFAMHGHCSVLGCPETEVVRLGPAGLPNSRRVRSRWRGRMTTIMAGVSVAGTAAAISLVTFAMLSPPSAGPPRPQAATPAPEDAPTPKPALPEATEPLPTFDPATPPGQVARRLLEVGVVRLARGEIEVAIKAFTWAIERDPDLVEAHVRRGEAYVAAGRFEDAVRDYSVALALDPRRVSAYLGRAEAHEARGDTPGALRDLDQALWIDKNDVTSLIRRGDTRLRDAGTDANKLQAAYLDFLRATELNSTRVKAWKGRALAERSLGRIEEALSSLDRAIALDPRATDLRWERTLLREDMGNTQGALQDLDVILIGDPKDALALLKRAQARRDIQDMAYALLDLDAALRIRPELVLDVDLDSFLNAYELDRAIAQQPASAWLNYLRGLAHQKGGQLEEAEASYRSAAEVDPGHVPTRYALARVHYSRGELTKALGELSRVLELAPTSVEAWAFRGEVRSALGEYVGAQEDFERALELDPGRADTYVRLGQVHKALDGVDEAIAAYTKAIELDPQHVTAYVLRGQAYEMGGKFDQALTDYQYVLSAHPGYAHAWLYAGLLREKANLGKIAAIDELQEFLRLAPYDEGRRLAIDALARLGVKVDIPRRAEQAPEGDKGPEDEAQPADGQDHGEAETVESPEHPLMKTIRRLRLGTLVHIRLVTDPENGGRTYAFIRSGPGMISVSPEVPAATGSEFKGSVTLDVAMIAEIRELGRRNRK